jgi:hypothetical protein
MPKPVKIGSKSLRWDGIRPRIVGRGEAVVYRSVDGDLPGKLRAARYDDHGNLLLSLGFSTDYRLPEWLAADRVYPADVGARFSARWSMA